VLISIAEAFKAENPIEMQQEFINFSGDIPISLEPHDEF